MADDFWHRNFVITPQPVSDLDVVRAANQLIKRFPDDPEMEAAQRADAAYELGDMFNFNLWMRISKAVMQLVRTKPDGQTLN